MYRLWQFHTDLTREVILSVKYSTENLQYCYNKLVAIEEDLGHNLAKFYGKSAGEKYTELLKSHVDSEATIIDRIYNNRGALKSIGQAKHNIKEIAKLLSRLNPKINYCKVKELLFDHLDCTIDEIVKVNKGQLDDSTKCSKIAEKIATYILS